MNSLKQFLKEADSKTLVFCFGRYNPPTKGHILHFEAMRSFAAANGYRYETYISKTVDNKKNPVPVEARIVYIKKAFPAMLPLNPATNMFTVVKQLSETGVFKNLIYMAGSDYFEDSADKDFFNRLVAHAAQNGVHLTAQMSRQREPQSELSGTVLRRAALTDDFATFLAVSPVGMGRLTEQDVRKMFELTKQGLQLPTAKRVKPQ